MKKLFHVEKGVIGKIINGVFTKALEKAKHSEVMISKLIWFDLALNDKLN